MGFYRSVQLRTVMNLLEDLPRSLAKDVESHLSIAIWAGVWNEDFKLGGLSLLLCSESTFGRPDCSLSRWGLPQEAFKAAIQWQKGSTDATFEIGR